MIYIIFRASILYILCNL